jgi:hypothetical protein
LALIMLISTTGMRLGLKRKRFFHFREKRKWCENEQIFAKFRFSKIFDFAKIFVFAKVFVSQEVLAKMGTFLR